MHVIVTYLLFSLHSELIHKKSVTFENYNFSPTQIKRLRAIRSTHPDTASQFCYKSS